MNKELQLHAEIERLHKLNESYRLDNQTLKKALEVQDRLMSIRQQVALAIFTQFEPTNNTEFKIKKSYDIADMFLEAGNA